MPHSEIERDADGNPVICDCPDQGPHPCDGNGWCRPGRNKAQLAPPDKLC